MSFIVRRMTLEDVPQVHAIETATFPTPWSEQSFIDEMTKNVCARYMVAEEDGQVIAFAGAWMILDEGHITNIAVSAPSIRPRWRSTKFSNKVRIYHEP